jgi:hypothetical protein
LEPFFKGFDGGSVGDTLLVFEDTVGFLKKWAVDAIPDRTLLGAHLDEEGELPFGNGPEDDLLRPVDAVTDHLAGLKF